MGTSSKELRGLLFEWAKGDKTVQIADFYAHYQKIMADPAAYGFDPAHRSDGCIEGGMCRNPDEHIWFDNVSLRLPPVRVVS